MRNLRVAAVLLQAALALTLLVAGAASAAPPVAGKWWITPDWDCAGKVVRSYVWRLLPDHTVRDCKGKAVGKWSVINNKFRLKYVNATVYVGTLAPSGRAMRGFMRQAGKKDKGCWQALRAKRLATDRCKK